MHTTTIVDEEIVPPHETDVMDSVSEALAIQSREFAERNEWHRHVIRKDRSWVEPHAWEAESKGQREALAKTIELLFTNYSNGGSIFVFGLLKELHAREKLAQEIEEELDNMIATAGSRGKKQGFHHAANTIREISDFGWPTPDPILD